MLSNPEKRQLYDDYGEEGVKNGGPPGGGGLGGLFDLFGRGKKQSGPKKGKPKLIELQVTLEEVYNGCMKTVKFKRYFFHNQELESVNLVMEKEEKMCKNVLNVKVKEE